MNNLNIVLVRSKYPRNIGLVSRVMCNFALERLILVAPQCELDEQARQGAAQGQRGLENVTIYPTWDEFHKNEPEGPRIGFSRRQGKRRASIPLDDLLSLEVIDLKRPTYLIFGAEDHGLSAEDLEMVHRMAYLTLPGELQSMNLSHSVLVATHSFFQKFNDSSLTEATESQPIANPEPFLELWLKSLDFDLESQPRWNALTMLKQLIMRATPTSDELHKLEMIVQQTVRRIRENKLNQ